MNIDAVVGMKSLLVSSSSTIQDEGQTGLFYLASMLDRLNIDFGLLDLRETIDYFNPPDYFYSNWEEETWLNKDVFYREGIIDYEPELIAADVIFYSALFSTDIIIHAKHAVEVKKANPNCETFIGGAAIQRLTYKQLMELKKVFGNVLTEDLDISPDFSLLPVKKYESVKTGNGCGYGRCRFCDNSSNRLDNGNFKLKKPDVIIKEMSDLKDRGVENIMLAADMLSEHFTKSLAAKLLEDYGSTVPYNIMVRAEKWVDEDLASSLKHSGCMGVFIGIEFLEDGVLKFLDKGTTVDNIVNCIKNLSKAGLEVEVGLITCIPKVTEKQFAVQLKNLELILPYVDCINLEILTIVNFSEFAASPHKYGIELYPPSEQSIIPCWCYGFSSDIPWTFIDKSNLRMWFDYYDELESLLGEDIVPNYYKETIESLRAEVQI